MSVRTAVVAACLSLVGTAARAQVPAFSHVFIIVMENQEYENVIGNPSAPYANALAQQYGIATNVFGVTHPSLPNYMALTAGDTFFTDDCIGCTTPAVNLLDRIEAAGRTWTAYMEDMPGTCVTTDSGLYVARHNPFVHYDDIVGNSARCAHGVVPFSRFSSDLSANVLANFVWITPNVCNDMHDCSVATGDVWLQSIVPQILQSPAFANSVLFIAWDEGTTNAGGGGHIPLIVASPTTPAGTRVGQAANHYDVLRTIEDAWSLLPLGQSASATALSSFFRAPAQGPPPPPPPGGASPANGATGVETNVTLTWSPTGAIAYEVRVGTSSPPPVVSTGQNQRSNAYQPPVLAANTTYFWQVTSLSNSGSGVGPLWSFTTGAGGGASISGPSGLTTMTLGSNAPSTPSAPVMRTSSPPTSPTKVAAAAADTLPSPDIVIYASDVPASAVHGSWNTASDPTSPGGVKIISTDEGIAHAASPLAAPSSYVDVTFTATVGTPYRFWLRLKATSDSKWNDSVWVQFSDAIAGGASIYPMNTTAALLVNAATDSTGTSLSGWAWQNTAYWLLQPTTVSFSTSGTHTLRIQIREDGVQFDQIVLSPASYLHLAPGRVSNDTTIVAKP